jgi:hypothetical protein
LGFSLFCAYGSLFGAVLYLSKELGEKKFLQHSLAHCVGFMMQLGQMTP